jgi:hypothetical protein
MNNQASTTDQVEMRISVSFSKMAQIKVNSLKLLISFSFLSE